jgi:chromosome segregation ATPase
MSETKGSAAEKLVYEAMWEKFGNRIRAADKIGAQEEKLQKQIKSLKKKAKLLKLKQQLLEESGMELFNEIEKHVCYVEPTEEEIKQSEEEYKKWVDEGFGSR